MALQMTVQQISTNVQKILEDSDLFVNVEAAPQEGDTIHFEGYPSAFHYYSATQPQVSNITQHKRTINYTVQAVVVVPDGTSSVDEFKAAYSLVDSLIQLFDQSQNLKVADLPRACDILSPTPGEMSRVDTNDGVGLLVTINLSCTADVTFRTV